MARSIIRTSVILGAGASRGVSYAGVTDIPSPLDADFFDLLQRLDPHEKDEPAVKAVREWAMSPKDTALRRSMERMFYTLHLRAYLTEKLIAGRGEVSSKQVITNFALAVQSLLRKAHGTRTCAHHKKLLGSLRGRDTIISFNYDLVVERALRPIAERRGVRFGPRLYGFEAEGRTESKLPLLLKLHGSSNWRIGKNGEFVVGTDSWDTFDEYPGYKRYGVVSSDFPIFLPFWEKRVEKGRWANLWRTAAERLGESYNLLVWGYSLPETDVKARELVRIVLGEKQVRLCVIDPSPATRGRWRDVLLNAKFWEYERISEFIKHPPPWWVTR